MTYVMSDFHGRCDLYQAMLEQISFSDDDRLYILGDAADRHEGGIQIYKDILDRANISLLMGNHERMMILALTDPHAVSLNGRETNRQLWYRNGGEITEKEFRAQPEQVQRRILNYLEELPLSISAVVNKTQFLLVHSMPASLFDKYGRFYDNDIDFAVWERIEPWMQLDFSEEIMICGHTPTAYYQDVRPMEIVKIRDNVYDIDCGCAAKRESGGRLGCMRLDDMAQFYAG